MAAEFIEGVFAAPVVGSLFLEAALFLLLRTLVKNDAEGISPWLQSLFVFFLVRDLISFFIPETLFPVRAITDAAAPAFALGASTEKSARLRSFAVGFAAAAVPVAILAVLFRASPLPAQALALIAALGACASMVKLRDKDAGVGRALSTSGRAAALAAFALPPLAGLAGAPFLRDRLAAPLAYVLIMYVMLDYARALEERLLADRDYLSDTIDKLYNFVFHASDSLRGGVSLDGLLDYVSRSIMEETNADGSLVLMVDDFEDVVSVRAMHGSFAPISPIPEEIDRDPSAIASWLRGLRIPLGEGFIGQTAQSGKPALIGDASADERIVVEPAIPAGSVIAVPFLIEDRVIGIGLAVRAAGSAPFADADFDRVSILADFASLVINDVYSFMDTTERGEVDREAAIAANIQKALQPKRLPEAGSAAFGAFSVPARGVCSDYYDVVPVRKDRVYLAMGDVAGKGIPASLIMVMIRAILHLLVSASKDTATILNWINRGITGKIELDHFATMQLCALDPTTGSCEFSNAGHRPPLVYRRISGKVDVVEMKSVPIGVEKSSEYSTLPFSLDPGDVMLLYSDGVVEAVNEEGQQYGMQRLSAAVSRLRDLEPKEIASAVREDVRAFIGAGRQHDDQTVLAIKAKS
jgi:sigma-B regulation protein RsbU (phosphoserine phosphatase)